MRLGWITFAFAFAFACDDAHVEQPDPCSSETEFCEPIPANSVPCTDATPWPQKLESSEIPVTVHYSTRADEPVASDVMALLEVAWRVEVDELGFSPPIADDGNCGEDDRYDVFVWRGSEESYVEAILDVPETVHDDWITYMVVDPWGPFGGDRLASTIAHELNHALVASDDWWESPLVFEMTATFMEEVVFPDANEYLFTLEDFQTRADWSVTRSDDWDTWYMYGASLYLQFLRKRYFDGDASFAARMWRLSRSDPNENEPDYLDALETILAERNATVATSVVEFARWRWYTGTRDDGRHFGDGALFPPEATVPTSATIEAGSELVLPVSPMHLGSVYLEVTRAQDAPTSMQLSMESVASDVDWVAQLVPGNDGSDGDPLDLGSGFAVLDMSQSSRRTLILTPLASAGEDPDEPSERRFGATVSLQ